MADRDWTDLVVGGDDTAYQVERTEELRRAVAALAGQARRQLDILTPDLEPAIYDATDFLDALRQLAIASRRTHLRVLVGDSESAVKRGHRIIELGRRLTTAIDIYRPAPGTEFGSEGFLLVDDRGLMWRANADRPEASVCFNDPMTVRRLRSRFDELWQEAQPDPELRRLHL